MRLATIFMTISGLILVTVIFLNFLIGEEVIEEKGCYDKNGNLMKGTTCISKTPSIFGYETALLALPSAFFAILGVIFSIFAWEVVWRGEE